MNEIRPSCHVALLLFRYALMLSAMPRPIPCPPMLMLWLLFLTLETVEEPRVVHVLSGGVIVGNGQADALFDPLCKRFQSDLDCAVVVTVLHRVV